MIISPARKFIFVHIPKTGGTSLALALEERAHRDDILIGDTPKAIKRKARVKTLDAKGRLWKHSTLVDLDGAVSLSDLDAMFVFTLVRNPWDRMVSYYHWLRGQSFDHPAVSLAKSEPFDGFILHPDTDASLRAFPAARYVTDALGVERCSAYVRLEHLAEDLVPVVAHLGFPLTMSHANASDRPRDYRRAYTAQSVDAVAAMCADDIARFDYRFDA